MVFTANHLSANSSFYWSNDPTNRATAMKDEDGRPDQTSVPREPHHHVTILQHSSSKTKHMSAHAQRKTLFDIFHQSWRIYIAPIHNSYITSDRFLTLKTPIQYHENCLPSYSFGLVQIYWHIEELRRIARCYVYSVTNNCIYNVKYQENKNT